MPVTDLYTNSAIAIYSTHQGAEEAVKELQKSGFDMKSLSIVGQDYRTEENVTGYYTLGDKMRKWGTLGAFWGGIWGLVFGAAFFWVPGIGQVVAGGTIVAVIVAVLEDAVIVGGLSVLGVALTNIGVPKDSALKYETEVKAGKFVVIAHGTPAQAESAHDILSRSKADSTALHSSAMVVASR